MAVPAPPRTRPIPAQTLGWMTRRPVSEPCSSAILRCPSDIVASKSARAAAMSSSEIPARRASAAAQASSAVGRAITWNRIP